MCTHRAQHNGTEARGLRSPNRYTSSGRARSDILKISIAWQSQNIGGVSIPIKGFGEAPALGVAYTLTLKKDQVLREFKHYYDDGVKDQKTHRIEDGDIVAQSPRDLNFPKWSDLLEKYQDSTCAFLQDVVYDFLNIVFLATDRERPRYFIQMVESVEFHGENASLVGEVLDYRLTLSEKPDSGPI